MREKIGLKILLVLGLVLALAVPVYAANFTWRCIYCGNVIHAGSASFVPDGEAAPITTGDRITGFGSKDKKASRR